MKNSNLNAGRKKGSKNKMTFESKEALLNIVAPHFKELNKNLIKLPFEERQLELKHYAKILTTGNDEVSQKTKELIFKELEGHFRKMRFYFPHISNDKKVTELRQFLKLLPSDKIEEILKDMNEDQNIKFR